MKLLFIDQSVAIKYPCCSYCPLIALKIGTTFLWKIGTSVTNWWLSVTIWWHCRTINTIDSLPLQLNLMVFYQFEVSYTLLIDVTKFVLTLRKHNIHDISHQVKIHMIWFCKKRKTFGLAKRVFFNFSPHARKKYFYDLRAHNCPFLKLNCAVNFCSYLILSHRVRFHACLLPLCQPKPCNEFAAISLSKEFEIIWHHVYLNGNFGSRGTCC